LLKLSTYTKTLQMKVLVIGETARYTALQQKGLTGHQVQWTSTLDNTIKEYDLVIDLQFDEQPQHAAIYAKHPKVPVLAGIAKTSLADVMSNYAFEQGFNIIGCNWLPGFIEMPVTEVSVMDESQEETLKNIMAELGWEYELVQDSVGMVTPRVVCMIINEAYLAAEEGVASRADIDVAMRLGTNYPKGPFEWCAAIGAANVHELLQAVHTSTKNERYKVSNLLTEEAQKI
jgi:3-hydroxybutyryl-CoA dehydrogenase